MNEYLFHNTPSALGGSRKRAVAASLACFCLAGGIVFGQGPASPKPGEATSPGASRSLTDENQPSPAMIYDALDIENQLLQEGANPNQLKGLPPQGGAFIWKSQPPEGCPFPPSERFAGLLFTGRGRGYGNAAEWADMEGKKFKMVDTWFPTWGADGHLYAPGADGFIWMDARDGGLAERIPASWDQGHWTNYADNIIKNAAGDAIAQVSASHRFTKTANAIMVGDDPLNLVLKATYMPFTIEDMTPWSPYPSACLSHKGVWYYALYGLAGETEDSGKRPHGAPQSPAEEKYAVAPRFENKLMFANYPILGPMSTFRISKDGGRSWIPYVTPTGVPQDPAQTPWNAKKFLFPETRNTEWLVDYQRAADHQQHQIARPATVKLGAPHFVDFGQDMEHSPDGKAYLVGMGGPASSKWRPADVSWISADQIYLARVSLDPQNPERINELESWEFFGGHDSSGKPVWVTDFNQIKPLLEWDDHMGCVTITYNAPLKTYFMNVTAGWPTIGPKDLYILEASAIEGPWKLVTYMRNFGPSNYFANIPSKFIQPGGKKFWLLYSNNRHLPAVVPRQSVYGATFVEAELIEK